MDASGKAQMLQVIRKMQAYGKTNLSGGLMQGIRLMTSEARDNLEIQSDNELGRRNQVVLLFTDGKATRGVTDTPTLISNLRQLLVHSQGISVFTFGYGHDHHPRKLHAIAEACNGLYYFIEQPDDIATAFADCLAGLAGMVAQEAHLELSVNPQVCKLGTIYFPNAQITKDGQRATITLGGLYAQETKEILIDVHLPAMDFSGKEFAGCDTPVSLVTAKLRFFASVVGKFDQVEASHDIIRPNVPSPPPSTPKWLELHTCRLQAVNAMNQAAAHADLGEFAIAKKLLTDAITLASVSMPQLAADLGFVAAAYRDQRTFTVAGAQRTMSAAMAHMYQRSNHATGAAYERSAKAMLKSKWLMAQTPFAASLDSGMGPVESLRDLAMVKAYIPAKLPKRQLLSSIPSPMVISRNVPRVPKLPYPSLAWQTPPASLAWQTPPASATTGEEKHAEARSEETAGAVVNDIFFAVAKSAARRSQIGYPSGSSLT